MPKIHKNQAVIHTATIDVKVLRLDRRQLTLSVFRQLDEETVFSSKGLRGQVWGRINYRWGDVSQFTNFFVVWQDGEFLKRSPVPKSPGWTCLYDGEDVSSRADSLVDWTLEPLIERVIKFPKDNTVYWMEINRGIMTHRDKLLKVLIDFWKHLGEETGDICGMSNQELLDCLDETVAEASKMRRGVEKAKKSRDAFKQSVWEVLEKDIVYCQNADLLIIAG